MIRTGDEYRESLRDGRVVYMDGERIADVTTHPAFAPIVDVRARIYDMAHDPATADIMSYTDPRTGERNAIGPKLPRTRDDWRAKRLAVDTELDDIRGIVTRVGDETVGEIWSLYDGQDLLHDIDPRFTENIRRHVAHAVRADPFHVSANTDPKGDRSKHPQDQDPDMLLHVVRETENGIVVRGPSTKPRLPMQTRHSSNRPSPIGVTASFRTMRSGSSRGWASRASCTSAAPGSPGAPPSPTTRSPTVSTKSTHW